MNKLLLKMTLLVACGMWLTGCDAGRDAYAVTTTDTLIRFQTDDAGKIEDEVTITGLDSGETLQQIDFRAKNGTLYGLTSAGFVVTVNASSGVATHLGTAAVADGLTNVVLDVNPQGDYLRVIGNQPATGGGSGATTYYNARVDPTTGAATTVDSTSIAFNQNDDNIGETPQLVAIAHTNNQSDATATSEYGLELTTQTLVRITTAGLLTTVGTVRGFTVNSGFDIVRNRGDNNGDDGIAYVALSDADGSAHLYEFDLTDGSTSKSDAIGNSRQIRSLAVSLSPPKRKGFSN